MKKHIPDPLMLNGYHGIMHLVIFLLGYTSASVFGVFILCYSLNDSSPVQLYPFLSRFVELFIDWSVGFCFFLILSYLFFVFIRTRFFPESYARENAFFLRAFRLVAARIRKALPSIFNNSHSRGA
ncbi:MAG: hypothetical protein D3906_15580 [Candidatus Electrothrix sp. AUS1_2]|nr:hypothetical protein [Candidatus Electrothrix sp. AUS1_2]